MVNGMKRLRVISLSVLWFLASANAFADAWHEQPVVYNDGEIVLYFGWAPDPPYAGEYAQFYFYAFADSKPAPPQENWGSGRCINTDETPTDVVKVTGKIQLLADTSPNAKVLKATRLPGNEFVHSAPDSCRYLVEFVPRRAGAYAFVLSGKVNGFEFKDLRLVCKKGELNTYLYDGFNCVADRQKPLKAAPVSIPSYRKP